VGVSRALPGRLARPWLIAACAFAALVPGASVARAYTFGEPAVRSTGPDVTVFDWTTQKCSNDDIPDQPSRAFRDSAGQVVLINSHHTVRRKTGPALDSVVHRCNIVMGSGKSTDPSRYDNREWLATTFTPDGSTVYGLIHTEYQGWEYGPGYCIKPGELFEDRIKCWYNALTLTTSTNDGATFSHAAPPAHYVAGPPYQYAAGIGPIGFFQPSNIVRGQDGYHYVQVHVEDYGAQSIGSCLMRSNSLDDPSSWRMWTGTGFNGRFRDPYLHTYPPEEGVCAPVPGIGTLSESLTWSTYLKKWVLVGSADNADGVSGPGFYYFTSDDLLNWSTAKLLMQAELPWTYRCQDGPEQVRDPSLLDGESKSRNFDTIGQRPYLFFTRFNITFSSPTSCTTSLDRDLARIPVEFSNQQPGGPAATLAASSTSVRIGEPVTFDASGSWDADGSITKYEWDLDGDGSYERDTGLAPVTRRAYASADDVTVTVRVSDDDGKATDETTVVRVREPGQEPAAVRRAPVAERETGGVTAAAGRFSSPRRVRGTVARGAVLRVRVPAAGTVWVRPVAGRRALRSARGTATGPGSLALRVLASRSGKALATRKGRVRVRVAVFFTPFGGTRQSAKATVTLIRPAR
jgi:hypothetical protein